MRELLNEQDLSRVSRILCLIVTERVVTSQAAPSTSAATETTHHSPVKCAQLDGKQHVESHESPATCPSSSLPMDLSDAPSRVRLNVNRSPLESHSERPKQRRVLEDPDGDEVMTGELQVNEEVEHPWSEVSARVIDDWQQREYAVKLKELRSQNDFMNVHGVPSSEDVKKEVIKNTLGVTRNQGDSVKARLVMKHFNT